MGIIDFFRKKKHDAPNNNVEVEIMSDDDLEEHERVEEIKHQIYIDNSGLLDLWVDNNHKGNKLEANGQIDDAMECYEENVRTNTDAPFTYDKLSAIYHYKKEFEKERDTLKLFIDEHSHYSNINENYKIDLRERYENVESYLNIGKWKYDCLPSDPKTTRYAVKEAKTLLNSEDKEKGIEMLEDLIDEGTYTNTVYNTLFQTYKKDKKFDDAIRICNKAIEVLGFFSNDRKNRWTINHEKVTKQKERELKKKHQKKTLKFHYLT